MPVDAYRHNVEEVEVVLEAKHLHETAHSLTAHKCDSRPRHLNAKQQVSCLAVNSSSHSRQITYMRWHPVSRDKISSTGLLKANF